MVIIFLRIFDRHGFLGGGGSFSYMKQLDVEHFIALCNGDNCSPGVLFCGCLLLNISGPA